MQKIIHNAPAQRTLSHEVVVSGTPILVEGTKNQTLASILSEALIAAGVSITSGEWLFTAEDGTVLADDTPLSDVKTRIFLSRSAGIFA